MHRVGVCVYVRESQQYYNRAACPTFLQLIGPQCSLVYRSNPLCSHSHTLSLSSVSSKREQHLVTFQLHMLFCQCYVLQQKLNSSLRLLFWLAASLQPQWPQQIACRHAVLGSMADLVRHVGQLVYGYCSMSLFRLLFLRPNNV